MMMMMTTTTTTKTTTTTRKVTISDELQLEGARRASRSLL